MNKNDRLIKVEFDRYTVKGNGLISIKFIIKDKINDSYNHGTIEQIAMAIEDYLNNQKGNI